MASSWAASGSRRRATGAAANSVQYLPLDAPAGMSQAVIVENKSLVHTRQLFPVDQAGNLVGGDVA